MNQPKLIKYLVLGLPLGLFFLGGASMIWHFKHPQDNAKKPKNEAKSKPVEQADLEFNVKRLAMELASRPSMDALKTRQTASFIEGSLGINNIGYPVVTRVNFPYAGREISNLSVEVKGSRSPEEIILVVAHYDSAPSAAGANANGSGVAANLSLANLFLRTQNERTIQFHFLANGLGPAPSGAEVLAKKFKALGSNILVTLVLDQLGKYNTTAQSQQPWPGSPVELPNTGNFVAWVGPVSSKSLAEKFAQSFTGNSTLTGLSLTVPDLGSATSQAFAQQGLPVLRVTDTGGLRKAATFAEADAVEELDFATFSEAVRGIGRTLQSFANE
jgi:hypothetical protein